MLFRPNFCANCGEKIDRVDWRITTSRRFCPVCESEFKGQDLIPRGIVILGVLVGVIGFGSYLKSGTPAAGQLVSKQTTRIANQQAAVNPIVTQPANANQAPRLSDMEISLAMPRTLVSAPPAALQPIQKVEATEQSYYCGAETKKGTPCSRRVKGNTRCYQHKGMPAMLPADKLKIG